MYQDWRGVIFLHCKADKQLLQQYLPKGTQLDLFNNEAWLSIVPFSGCNAHPRLFPPIPAIANFHEVNLRTYVTDGNMPGVCFHDIKANNAVQVFFNRLIGLPYRQSTITRTANGDERYQLHNAKQTMLDLAFTTGDALQQKSPLDKWLTERYCCYQQTATGTYRYPIHHIEWPLQQVQLQRAEVNWNYKSIHLTENRIELVHYSPGLSVLFWAAGRV